jgi:hypothetical protein
MLCGKRLHALAERGIDVINRTQHGVNEQFVWGGGLLDVFLLGGGGKYPFYPSGLAASKAH